MATLIKLILSCTWYASVLSLAVFFLVPICPVNFTFLPAAGGCYQVIGEALNWNESQARCPTLDPRAHLVVIRNGEQNQAVINYLDALYDAHTPAGLRSSIYI